MLGLRCNRLLNGIPVEGYKKGMHHANSKNLSFDKHDFHLRVRRGKLNNVKNEQRVLISKRVNRSTGQVSFRYFTSNLEDAVVIFYWMKKRWVIETFHQIFKEHFKPERWRLRRLKISNLLTLSTMSIGYAIKYFLDKNTIDITGLEHPMEHSIISESLNYIKSVLISNREVWETKFKTKC